MCLGVTHVHAKQENTHMIIFAHRYIYTFTSISQTLHSRALAQTRSEISLHVFWCACTLVTMYTPGLAYVDTHTCVLLQGVHT